MTVNRQIIEVTLLGILKKNAPVRDGVVYPGARGASPYPGNLKNNGIVLKKSGNMSMIEVGGVNAPYAVYTETRSHKKSWQEKSHKECISRLQRMGGKEE